MADLILWNSNEQGSQDYRVPVRPAGPHQLAHWLTLHGYNVKVIDFCNLLSVDELLTITSKYITTNTVAIGVSTTFWKLNYSDGLGEPDWVMTARARLSSKNIKWILGGANSQQKNLKYDWIKFHGLAEDSLLKFMDESTRQLKFRKQFDIKNLESIFLDNLYIQSTETLPIELSRGCQFKCSFCRYPLLGKKKNTYLRDFSLIEKEFIENYERYGVTKYFFLDDTFNESDEKVDALANIAQRLPFKLKWFGHTRLDLMGSKPHTVDLLKQSGLKSSFFGIESFNLNASKIVGKGWNGVHGKDFILKVKEAWGKDISFHLGFIAGLTGEKISDIYETHEWCIANDIPSWKFNSLKMNKDSDYVVKSEFDLNYHNYGYRFPDDSRPDYWENDDWNYDIASDLSTELLYDAHKYVRFTSWGLGEVSSLGYDVDTLINTKRKDMDWADLRHRTDMFIQRYVESSLRA